VTSSGLKASFIATLTFQATLATADPGIQINLACARRPLVTAALGQFDGTLTTIRAHETGPDGTPNPTYRCLFPEPPPDGAVPTCAEAGALGALAGIVGAMMALEVIREIVPFGEGLVGRLLLIDARDMRFETLAYRFDPDNPLSGRTAAEAAAG